MAKKNRNKKAEAPAIETPNEQAVDPTPVIETPAPVAPAPVIESDPATERREGENKSQWIRRLSEVPFNKTPGQIAKIVGVRYQHAYNVLKRPLKGRAQ